MLALCDVLAGDVARAIGRWEAGVPMSAEERALERGWLVSWGDCAAALACERDRFRALAQLGVSAPAYEDALRITGGHASSPERTTALAAAFSRLGWIDEALAVLQPARGPAADDPNAATLRASLFAQRQLEAELRVIAEETYRASDAGQPPPSLDEFLTRLGAAAQRALGDDLLNGIDRIDFFPVGELVDPASEGGLPGYFRGCGRLLVVGKRIAYPPEILLLPVLATATAGPQRALLCFTEGVRIPSYLQHQGANLSGAALARFAYVDVAALEDEVARLLALERRLGPDVERVRFDPVLPAATRAERLAVDEPAEVATKLMLRALEESRARSPDPATLLADALDAVLQHEIGHLEDADRFLPLSRRIWSHLGELLVMRFSPKRIEEWLEMRAECMALARARNPHFVLAAAASLDTEGPTALTPHGAGYRELLARLVQALDEEPAEAPELDATRVLVQQLDRLSAEQIRRAARRVLQGLGIDEPADAAEGATRALAPR